MILAVSTIAAIVPAIFYVAIIYTVDRYEKEPLWLLAATFFWGAVPAIVTALIFNGLFGLPFYLVLGSGAGDAAVATFVAPLVEESAKGAALLVIFFFWRNQIDSLLDGIIYGAMVGMGFAMIENIFYFVNVYNEGGVEAFQTTFVLRVIVFGFNHSLFSGMTGLGIAWARLNKNSSFRYLAPVAGWAAGVFLHFVHNGLASLGESLGGLACIPLLGNAWGGTIITLIIVVWSLRQEKAWLQRYLVEDVKSGLLTMRQYEVATSGRKRMGHHLEMFSAKGFNGFWASIRFYDRLAKLAYLKHHDEWYHDKRTYAEMVKVRKQLEAYRQRLL